MPLVKAIGNMYQGWVTHCHSHLGGKCLHECTYCYVQTNRFGVPERYKGDIRLIERELKVNYGSGKSIFIEHMNDLFAEGVDKDIILEVLLHCCNYPDNTYIFQTKNPNRYSEFNGAFPHKVILGTTLETNREDIVEKYSKAPPPAYRFLAMCGVKREIKNIATFITVEPIMKFDYRIFGLMLVTANPDFINIGADSKNNNLPEPTKLSVKDLINGIKANNIKVNLKNNLSRIYKEK